MITTLVVPVIGKSSLGTVRKNTDNQDPDLISATNLITASDLAYLSDNHRSNIFSNRSAEDVRWIGEGYLAIDWRLCLEKNELLEVSSDRFMEVVVLPTDHRIVGGVIHKTTDSVYEHTLLNANNPLVQWLISVRQYCEQDRHGLRREQLVRLAKLVADNVRYFNKFDEMTSYLRGWRGLPNLPLELYPPEIELSAGMFVLRPPFLEGGNPSGRPKPATRRYKRQQKSKSTKK